MNTVKKVRSDSKCFGLSRPQLAKLEGWLFEENISYDNALARARAELGFTGSRSGLQRFYTRRSQERLLYAKSAAPENENQPVTPGVAVVFGIV